MKALLIKPDHLGDFALTLPALYEAVTRYGRESFLILASPVQKEWASILPWLPRVISWEHPRYVRGRKISFQISFFDFLALGLHLREEKWDYGIELTSSRHDFWGKAIQVLSGCQHRIGLAGHHDFWLQEKRDLGSGHQRFRMAQRFPREWEIQGKISPQQWMPSDLRWKKESRNPLFFPWAGTEAKSWSPESWKALHDRFPNARFLTPEPLQKKAATWSRDYGIPTQAWLITSSIRQTLEILSNSRALVALDTGVAHFAWLTGTPLIQLFAATTEVEPWQSPGAQTVFHFPQKCSPCKKEQCDQTEHLCMNAITVEAVAEALERL